jgi:hypothetical protein
VSAGFTQSLHFPIESDNGIWREVGPVCGNDFRRRKKLTEDWTQITCPQCIRLCGFEVVPEEQLTDCGPDPLKSLEPKKRAA